MDELDEEANEAHDGKADRCGHSYLLELFPVGLGTPLDQSDGVLGKGPRWLNMLHHLIHG